MPRKDADIKRIIFGVISSIICISVLVITIFGGDIIPDWNKIYKSFGISSKNNEQSDFIKFIDVGQADSALIYSNGYAALIDTATASEADDICKVLYDCGVTSIDALIISHLHNDHIGGISRIVDELDVSNLILPELSTFSEGMGSAQLAINAVTKSGGDVYTAARGMNFKIGDFEVTILESFKDMKDENNRSTIVMAEIRGKKFMFTGDAETIVENALLDDGYHVDCDVLKVSHHGSNTSSSKRFIDMASPEYAVISVGKGNSYGHPHAETLSNLKYCGAEIYRTDKSGDITFYVKDNQITVKTEK